MEIPVYLFTGFLGAGKTRFIEETLEDPRFNSGESTLLLLCEEGEEEYSPDQFSGDNVHIRSLDRPEELTEECLRSFWKELHFTRMLVEYNGMWPLDRLYESLPDGWLVYQEFCFFEAGSFLSFNTNLHALTVDKLGSCELVVFNRMDPGIDRMAFHKIVRAQNRRTDIAYEAPDGQVTYDDIEDPLPFDKKAAVIEISDQDYALWYRDLMEETESYQGKTVRFTGLVTREARLPSGFFAVGRQVMTCCVEDMTFAGLACHADKLPVPKPDTWITLSAAITIRCGKKSGQPTPLLTAVSISPAVPPEEPVAVFY